ncbi:MAG TPA: hypothetical protein VNT26_14225 [Candidatus Sulfotelmatobacter sp.]|nr:hypothetical protein [Candidatus Sulfotelmatobacter sp.]
MLSDHPHSTSLPSPEERRQIMERAGMVLAEARTLMDQLDRTENQLLWNRQAGHGFAPYSSWQSVGSGLAAALSAGPRSTAAYGQATVG